MLSLYLVQETHKVPELILLGWEASPLWVTPKIYRLPFQFDTYTFFQVDTERVLQGFLTRGQPMSFDIWTPGPRVQRSNCKSFWVSQYFHTMIAKKGITICSRRELPTPLPVVIVPLDNYFLTIFAVYFHDSRLNYGTSLIKHGTLQYIYNLMKVGNKIRYLLCVNRNWSWVFLSVKTLDEI